MKASLLVATFVVALFPCAVLAFGGFQSIQFPGSSNTAVTGVSGAKIVGTYWNSSSALQHGFIYDGVNYSTLDFPGSTSTGANGIDADRVVGGYTSSREFGFKFDAGTFSTIDPPATSNLFFNGSTAVGISGNNIVGNYIDDNDKTHGYKFDGTTYSTIDNPAGAINFATDIDGSLIVGQYTTADPIMSRMYGYIFDGINFTNLDFPGAGPLGTSAHGISGSRVVGAYWDASARPHGMIYQLGQYQAYNVSSALGRQTQIQSIDGNTIVGYYVDTSFHYHGFVDVIPEPSTLVLAVGIFAPLAVRRRRK